RSLALAFSPSARSAAQPGSMDSGVLNPTRRVPLRSPLMRMVSPSVIVKPAKLMLDWVNRGVEVDPADGADIRLAPLKEGIPLSTTEVTIAATAINANAISW